MSKAGASGVSAGALQWSAMEDRLRRTMADLAAQGADATAPVDPTHSLAAMAALLHEAIRPATGKIAVDQGSAGGNREGDGERPQPPRSNERDQEAFAKAAAPTRGGGAPPDPSTLANLSRHLDQIDERLRAGASIDPLLKNALTDLETRLRQSAGQKAKPVPATGQESASVGRHAPGQIPSGPERGRDDASRPPSATEGAGIEAQMRDLTALLAIMRDQRMQAAEGRGGGGPSKGVHSPTTTPAAPRDGISDLIGAAHVDRGAVAPASDRGQSRDELANDAAVSPVEVGAIESELRALTRKAEEAIARSRDPAPYDALARHIEATHGQLAERFETGLATAATETTSLRNLVQALADKIESTNESAVEALERDVGAMAKRLDEADNCFASIGKLERTVDRLFEQVEETRRAAAEAMAAAQNGDSGRSTQRTLDTQIEHDDRGERVAIEIASLRSAREEGDSRVHLALNAVHETVGKIAERLAKIETDLGGAHVFRDPLSLTPTHAEQRQKSETPVAAFSDALAPARSRVAEAPDPIPVKTRETRSATRIGRDGARSSAADSVDEIAEPSDFLIEPGSGFPRRREPAEPRGTARPQQTERDRGAAGADFIAAARRAAQAAQRDAQESAAIRAEQSAGRRPASARRFFNGRSRPILLAAAALCLALGAYALARTNGLKTIDPSSLFKSAGKIALGNAAIHRRDADVASAPASASPRPARPGKALEAAPKADPAKAHAAAAMEGFKANPAPGPSGLLDPTPLDLSSFTRRSMATPREFPSSNPNAPWLRAIAGSDPIVVGAIGGPAGIVPSTIVAAPRALPAIPRLSAGPSAVVANLPTTPLEDLRAKAEAGDAPAQFELGARFADGRAGSQDMALAAQFYARAADRGLALAQYRLAVLTEKGLGVGRDPARAQSLYLAAAAQGNARAMHNLGVLSIQSVNGRPDYEAAANWFEKAAEFNVRDSQFNLAVLLAQGAGVPRDAARAFTWFSIAATAGDAEAGRKRDEVALTLSPPDLDAAKAAAESFRPRPLDPAVNEIPIAVSGSGASEPFSSEALSPRVPKL